MAADHLNSLYENTTFDEIRRSMGQLDTLEFEVAHLVLDILGRSDNRSISDIYRDGLINLLEDEGTRQAVRVLEERTLLANVISQSMLPESSGVQVVIGGDGRWEELKDCTIILSRYGVPDDFSGTVAVIGPTRMSYGRNVAAVRYIADLMSNFVYDYYADPIQQESLIDKEPNR
jgi:heat-inducible transcriptional repressor